MADRLTLEDLQLGTNTYPHLADLAERGAVGAMNCATGGGPREAAAMLALATGMHGMAMLADEEAGNSWEPYTRDGKEYIALEYAKRAKKAIDYSPIDNSERTVKHLGIGDWERRGLLLGRIGAVLQRANPPVRVSVYGNADTDWRRRRVALFTTDEHGEGEGLLALRSYAEKRPFGLTDDALVLSEYALKSDADLVVIQLGDSARAEALRNRLTPAEYHEARINAIRRLNLLVYTMTAQLESEAMPFNLIIVSPLPPAPSGFAPFGIDQLTPFIAFGKDFPPGLLTSATTRTPGLVSNADLAPMLLKLFNAPSLPKAIGRPMSTIPDAASAVLPGGVPPKFERLAQVARLDYVATLNVQALTPVILGMGTLYAVGFLFGMFGEQIWEKPLLRLGGLLRLIVLMVPIAMLFAPILVPPTLSEYLLRIAALSVGFAVGCLLLAKPLQMQPHLIGCLLTWIILLADMLFGANLLRESALSNYAIPGYRYYGLGNDYLGILLAMCLVTPFLLKDNLPQITWLAKLAHRVPIAILVCWVITAFVAGIPQMGANSGSLVVFSVAIAASSLLLFSKPLKLKWMLLATFGGLVLAFGVAGLDAALFRESSSHAGAVVQQVATSGKGSFLFEVALRKLILNLRILALPMTLMGLILITTMYFLVRKGQPSLFPNAKSQTPNLYLASKALLPISIAAFVFKDSGVITIGYLCGYYLLCLLHTPLLQTSSLPDKETGNEELPTV